MKKPEQNKVKEKSKPVDLTDPSFSLAELSSKDVSGIEHQHSGKHILISYNLIT